MINNIKKITQDFIDDAIPNRYDQTLLKKLNLLDDNNDINKNYIIIASTYKYLLEKMLVKELNLKQYDDTLKSSNLNFKQVDEKNMDIYQYYSNMNLEYIYLRNNIYIENLTNEERQVILNKYNSNNLELDDATLNFINNTYVKVIMSPHSDAYIPTYEIYHVSPNPKFSVVNTQLILGVRYDEFYNKGLDDDTWNEMYMQREKFIYDLINDMNSNLQNKNITVLRYTEYAVKVKKNDNVTKSK